MELAVVIDKVKSNQLKCLASGPSQDLSWMKYSVSVEVGAGRMSHREADVESASQL